MTAEQDLKTVEDILARLNANPLFALSLSSNELFHSNFLWWLFRNNRAALGPVLDLQDDFGEIDFLRENDDIDLQVRDKLFMQVHVAIEVKVKDLPDPDQLAKYEKVLAAADAKKAAKKRSKSMDPAQGASVLTHKILLSLSEPSFVEPGGWRHLTFSKLGEGIKAWASPQRELQNQTYIGGYATLCLQLHELGQAISNIDASTRQYWFPALEHLTTAETVDAMLKDCRLEQVFNKRRASRLSGELRDEASKSAALRDIEFLRSMSAVNEGDATKLIADYDLPRTKPLAEICVAKRFAADQSVCLGVQIEDRQYRRYVRISPSLKLKRSKVDAERSEERLGKLKLVGLDPWIRFETSAGRNSHYSGPQDVKNTVDRRMEICGYDEATYTFIYDYIDVGSRDGFVHVLPKDIPAAAIQDIEVARLIIENSAFLESCRMHFG